MVTEVELQPEEKRAIVSVPEDQQSLAIGKEGQNARLANKLTKWKIDIKGAVGLFSQNAGDEPKQDKEQTVRGVWDDEIQTQREDAAADAIIKNDEVADDASEDVAAENVDETN